MAENGGANGNSANPADWEMLSMTMSTADIKSTAISSEGGVSDATMHSQYFGRVSPPLPLFFSQERNGGSSETSKKDGDAAIGQGEMISGSGTSESNRGVSDELESLFSSPVEKIPFNFDNEQSGYFGQAANGEEMNVGVVVEEIVVSSSNSEARGRGASKGWWLRRLAKQMNQNNTVWSVALVAAVVGLVIVGRRWHQERLRNLQLQLQICCNEEKINQLAHQLSEMENNNAAAAAAAAAVTAAHASSAAATPATATAGGGRIGGFLRDLW